MPVATAGGATYTHGGYAQKVNYCKTRRDSKRVQRSPRRKLFKWPIVNIFIFFFTRLFGRPHGLHRRSTVSFSPTTTATVVIAYRYVRTVHFNGRARPAFRFFFLRARRPTKYNPPSYRSLKYAIPQRLIVRHTADGDERRRGQRQREPLTTAMTTARQSHLYWRPFPRGMPL